MYRIFESTLYRTNSAVIATDDLVLVSDPTWLPHEISAIRRFVDEIRHNRPLFLLLTHSDYDHIVGFPAFSEATVIASRAFTDNPDREEPVRQMKQWDDQYYINRWYEVVYPRVDFEVNTDGDQLQVGGTLLTFYLAPGHNADGLFTLVENEGIWLAGDYLSNVEFPFIYHSSQDYESTLLRAEDILHNFEPALLLPGHGDPTPHLEEMQRRILDSRTYIRDLRQSITEGLPFDLDAWLARYPFPGGLISFHQDNEKLMRRELGL